MRRQLIVIAAIAGGSYWAFQARQAPREAAAQQATVVQPPGAVATPLPEAPARTTVRPLGGKGRTAGRLKGRSAPSKARPRGAAVHPADLRR